MLTKLFDKAFDRVDLLEEDIRMFEETVHSTAVQDVSSLNTTNYDIETRSGLVESAVYLKDSYFLVKFKLANQDGTAPYPANVASLTHSAWSLFSSVTLEVNQSPIERVNYPGNVFNVLTKSSKGINWLYDKAHENFYYPSHVGAGIDPLLAGNIVNASDTTDTNFNVGDSRLSGGTSVWCCLRLADVIGFCNMEKPLTGVSLVLRLEKNTNYDSILMRSIAGDNVNLITVVEQIKWYIPAIKVKSNLAKKLNLELLKEKPQPLDWMHIGYQQLKGTGTSLILNLFKSGRRIHHLFVMPQLEAQVNAQLEQTRLRLVESHNHFFVFYGIGVYQQSTPYTGLNIDNMVNYVGFYYNSATHGGDNIYRMISRDGSNSSETITTKSVNYADFESLKFLYDATIPQVSFFVNEAPIGTKILNLPSPTALLCPYISVYNDGSSSERTIHIDYISLKQVNDRHIG